MKSSSFFSALRAVLPAAAFAAAGMAAPAGPFAPNPRRGRVVFQQNCALCHATGLEAHPISGQGPLLAGVVGRQAASLANFGYSKALAASHLIWNSATLDRFLSGPGAFVPGTTMVATVPGAADRRDLIAFLATLRPLAPPTPRESVSLLPRVRTPGDWQNDAPGVVHRIDLADLPRPYATASAGNPPITVDRPPGAHLAVPPGFRVELFASGLSGPRLLRTAPNGDIFIAETRVGRIRVLRAADGADAPSEDSVYADGLQGPFGIAFYPLGAHPRWVYVAELNGVVRFPYRSGDLKARGPAETIVPELAASTGGHTTRDVAFSLDGRRMFISVGSGSNIADGMPVKTPSEVRAWEATHARGSAWGYETDRADIEVTDPAGRGPLRIYATGIRNAVGIAVQPGTGELWVSTNERDGLGDDLVPDYITHVREGGFYGWPWYYMGDHEDPRHAGERPDLAGAAIVPDVPVQSHSATLEMTFYPEGASGPAAFPADYRGDIFAAFHGSWNRTGRTGSKVVRVLLQGGVPTGAYEDFLTGFVVDDGHVWGRPVGVAVAHDGALLVTDDANGTLWRVAYAGRRASGRDLVFGITPVLGQSTMRTDFDPLMDYLSRALGRKVSLYVARDYGDLRTRMEAGAVDIGSFSPFAYVDAARGGKIRLIAQSLIDGAAHYRGVIIARRDSGLRSLADLRGKRFAYVDPKSASGYVYPRAMLIGLGFDPGRFFGSTFFAGDHGRVIASVLDGRADAGAAYDGALRLAKAAGEPTDELAVLARSEPIPHDAIAVRIGLDPALALRIREALTGMTGTEAGRRVLAENKKGLTGFAAAVDSQFDSVRRTARAAGL